MKHLKAICISPYPPRQCGIANYTKDLVLSIKKVDAKTKVDIIAIHDNNFSISYPKNVKLDIKHDSAQSYVDAARYLNFSDYDVVIIEHEFGLYGGVDGSHILKLVDAIRKPYVITFHTILSTPDSNKTAIVNHLIKGSSAIIVMADAAIKRLNQFYNVDLHKIYKIPHGVPNVPYNTGDDIKERLGLSGREVISTFGLISQNKGIEYVIEAMSEVAMRFPSAIFLVIGKTHPVVRRFQGESYRNSLKTLAKKYHLDNNVHFINKYLVFTELMDYLAATDIYITPYLEAQQITSGTLAYALGAGKACISTPYAYAKEVLASDRGFLVPFRNSKKITEAISTLLSDDKVRKNFSLKGYNYSRNMLWENVALEHLNLLNTVILD